MRILTNGASKIRILFLCVHNSARSQIAEGLLRAFAGNQFDVFSAGSEPSRVNPFAIRVMQERGIDISHQRAKSVNELANDQFDYVITLCAEEVCPIFLNATTRWHWALPDPSAFTGNDDEKMEAFRRTRNEIEKRLTAFVSQVTGQ